MNALRDYEVLIAKLHAEKLQAEKHQEEKLNVEKVGVIHRCIYNVQWNGRFISIVSVMKH